MFRHRRGLRKVERHGAHAATFQLRHEGAEVGVGLAVGAPLVVAGDEGYDAVVAAHQTLQCVGEAALGQLIQPLLAAAVVDDQRAIHGDAQLAHLRRVQLRVDEMQREVGFYLLIALQITGHGLAQITLRIGVADDVHRTVERGEHRAAFRRQAAAPVGGPVRLVKNARAEVAHGAGDKQKDQREQPAVQTSKQSAHQPRSLSADSRCVARASDTAISSTNHTMSVVDTSPRSIG